VVEENKIASWTTYLTPKEAVRAAKELLGGQLDKAPIKRRTTRPPTKSEEQKRAARTRAQLRKRASRQSA
jgi:hypothetical protein